jgi:hypothetical protein
MGNCSQNKKKKEVSGEKNRRVARQPRRGSRREQPPQDTKGCPPHNPVIFKTHIDTKFRKHNYYRCSKCLKYMGEG